MLNFHCKWLLLLLVFLHHMHFLLSFQASCFLLSLQQQKVTGNWTKWGTPASVLWELRTMGMEDSGSWGFWELRTEHYELQCSCSLATLVRPYLKCKKQKKKKKNREKIKRYSFPHTWTLPHINVFVLISILLSHPVFKEHN